VTSENLTHGESEPLSMSWQPPLRGASAKRALALVDLFASQLKAEDFGPGALGVGSGPAGLALFLAYVAKARNDGALSKRSGQVLNVALERGVPPHDASLLSGFAGLMWLLQHLPAVAGDATAVLEHADRAIGDALSLPHWDGPFYLAEGLLGFGVYLLERPINPMTEQGIARIIQHLDRLAVEEGPGVAWLRPAASFPPLVRPDADVFDLGIPRGVTGAIAFLAAASQRPAARGLAQPLLRRAVDWLVQQQSCSVAWGRFGSRRTPAEPPPPPTRLAWCYGDLGISIAILAAARALSDAALEKFAIDLALFTTERRGPDTEIADASFCHGSAGAAHLYARLYQATADLRFLEASRHWFEAALEMHHGPDGIHGFSTYYATDENTDLHRYSDHGLLMGSVGIGLMLLSACRPIEPNWDRFMLIRLGAESAPQRREDGSRSGDAESTAAPGA
jgi:hypothetical protein